MRARLMASSRSARSLAAFCLGVLGVGACSLLIDKDVDQCNVDADCDARGAAFSGRTCVDHVCVAHTTETDAHVDGDTRDDTHPTDSIVDAVDGESTPPDAGDPNAPVFVVSGTTASGGVLAVIDAATGDELKRETLAVAGLAYDPGLPTGGGDVFFVFEDDGSTTDGGLPGAKLHARTFDPVARTWTEVGSVTPVPKPKSEAEILVMNGRLIYVAPDTAATDPLAIGQLFIIDVSNPVKPALVCNGCMPGPANVVDKGSSTENYLGTIVGARADDALTGGIVGVPFVQACTGTGSTCPTYFQRFRYTGNDGTDIPGQQAPFGDFTSDVTVGLGSSYRHKAALMVVPTGATTGAVLMNSSTFFSAADTVASFDFSGRPTFSQVILAGCEDVALFTTFAGKLFAVPFTGSGLTTTSIEGASASHMAYATRANVVAYLSNGLKAARVDTKPALALTSLAWPTRDFVPNGLVGRSPGNACP